MYRNMCDMKKEIWPEALQGMRSCLMKYGVVAINRMQVSNIKRNQLSCKLLLESDIW